MKLSWWLAMTSLMTLSFRCIRSMSPAMVRTTVRNDTNIDVQQQQQQQGVASGAKPRSESDSSNNNNNNMLPLSINGNVKVRQCEAHNVDLCRGFGYNVTGWPNLVGHDSLVDAEQQLRTFTPLVQYGCGLGGELRFFLCAVYIPMCTEKVLDVIGPCRPVCERVRGRCEPVLHQFGFPWPSALNCSRFHARNDNTHMCMEGPLHGTSTDDKLDRSENVEPVPDDPCDPTSSRNGCNNRLPDAGGGQASEASQHQPQGDPSSVDKSMTSSRDKCTVNETGTYCRSSPDSSCVGPHHSSSLITIPTIVFSALCLVSVLLYVLTVSVDDRRHSYVDRIVLLLSVCSSVCAVALLTSVAVGGRVACSAPVSSDCKVVFVLVYYFSSAGAIWWLVLTLAWTMTVGYQFSDDSLRRLSTWFHLVAWTVSAILTIVALVRKDVELDRVTGLCRVVSGAVAQYGLVLGPLAVYLALGIVLLGLGLIRWRRLALGCHQQQRKDVVDVKGRCSSATQRDNLSLQSTVAGRVGFIVVLGLLSLLCCVSSLSHELVQRQRETVSATAGDIEVMNATILTALVRILSPLLIGIAVGPWVLITGQAVETWKKFVRRKRRRCTCSDQRPVTSAITSVGAQIGSTQLGGQQQRQWRPLLNGITSNGLKQSGNWSEPRQQQQQPRVHESHRHHKHRPGQLVQATELRNTYCAGACSCSQVAAAGRDSVTCKTCRCSHHIQHYII